jgi:hypothetical protein
MSSLTVSTTYLDGNALTEAQLDSLKSQLESFYNNPNIEGNNIQDNSLNASIVLANKAITENKLSSNSVVNAKIEDEAVTNIKLQDSIITNAKLSDSSITTSKLANSFIPGSALSANSFPKSKLPEVLVSSGSYDGSTNVTSTSSSSPTIVETHSSTSLVIGKPVIVTLIPDLPTTAQTNYIQLTRPNSVATTTVVAHFALQRDGTTITAFQEFSTNWSGDLFDGFIRIPTAALVFIDPSPTSTSHSYAIVGYKEDSVGSFVSVFRTKLQLTQVS